MHSFNPSCHVCRTSTLSKLKEQQGNRKRSRAGASESGAVGELEAAALHWLRTGVEAATEGVSAAAVESVKRLLRLETAGLSSCGACSMCLQGGECIRASNRAAAREGKREARWAEECGRLTGRRFEVCAPPPNIQTWIFCICMHSPPCASRTECSTRCKTAISV
jgi:hypothetical protein